MTDQSLLPPQYDTPPPVNQLDASQRAFCEDASKAVRLLAPAGSGKTYSLLHRCANRMDQTSAGKNVRFLVFTFTRAARDELRDRLKNNPAFSRLQPWIEVTTLNSYGFKYLKGKLHNLKLVTSQADRNWTLQNLLQPVWQQHDRVRTVLTDSKRKIRAGRTIMELNDIFKGLGFRHDSHSTPEKVGKHIAWLLECRVSAHLEMCLQTLDDLEIIDLTSTTKSPLQQMYEQYFQFWRESTLQMYQSAVVTLEDQKYWHCLDLERSAAEGKFTTGMHRYDHILVDEFQDVNVLDMNLLKAVAAVNKCQLTIVGDDDQAIYEWRGAAPEFILAPDKHLSPGYRTHVLEVNYRSPKNLVELSQKLIQHNKRRVPKSVRAYSQSEAEVVVHRTPDVEQSVSYIADLVHRLLDDPEIRNIAIIGRKRSQIIPYQIVFAGSNTPFYAAEDLQVLLSDAFESLKKVLLLKAQCNMELPFGPDPVEGLLQLCDLVRRYPLSKVDRQGLKTYLLGAHPKSIVNALELLYGYTGSIKGDATGTKPREFYEKIKELIVAKSVAESIKAISTNFSGLQKDYGKSVDDIFYTDPPFLYLGEFAHRYGDDFKKFYQDMDLAITTLAKIPPEDQENSDESWKRPLHLMTALRAKGKEFDAVIILDCNNGIWPSQLAKTEDQLEAERRLFYVAFTRARKKLFLVVDEMVFDQSATPSPYLSEMGLI